MILGELLSSLLLFLLFSVLVIFALYPTSLPLIIRKILRLDAESAGTEFNSQNEPPTMEMRYLDSIKKY